MKKILLGALLCAASVTRVDAQTKTYHGCSTFSCHTATFTLSDITPFQGNGRTWTKGLSITWTHDFQTIGGYFRTVAFDYPIPIRNGFDRNSYWDSVGWSGSNWCFYSVCKGLTITEYKQGPVDDDWMFGANSVIVYAPVDNPWLAIHRDQQPEIVPLQLVPEPATWALLAGGLGLLGVVRRGRRRAA